MMNNDVVNFRWLESDIPAPHTKPTPTINRFHPRIQRRTLGFILESCDLKGSTSILEGKTGT
jgi:hypothetical protein